MQTALCQEVNVPQVLLKSIALLDLSCICFWERTQLLFYSAGNSLCRAGMWCGVHLQAGCRHSTAAWFLPPSSQPGFQLDLPHVRLRNNLLGSRQILLPNTYLLHVLFKALRYIHASLWFA